MSSEQTPEVEVQLHDAEGFSPLRNILKQRLIKAAIAKGATREEVENAIGQAEGDRPLLDWLKNGGFQELLKFIMELIAILK